MGNHSSFLTDIKELSCAPGEIRGSLIGIYAESSTSVLVKILIRVKSDAGYCPNYLLFSLHVDRDASQVHLGHHVFRDGLSSITISFPHNILDHHNRPLEEVVNREFIKLKLTGQSYMPGIMYTSNTGEMPNMDAGKHVFHCAFEGGQFSNPAIVLTDYHVSEGQAEISFYQPPDPCNGLLIKYTYNINVADAFCLWVIVVPHHGCGNGFYQTSNYIIVGDILVTGNPGIDTFYRLIQPQMPNWEN